MTLNILISTIVFFNIYANAETSNGRWSLGLLHNAASLSTNEVETSNGIIQTEDSKDTISFETSSFSGNGLSVGYKNKINQSFLSQELLWETNLFFATFNPTRKTVVSNQLCAESFSLFSDSFSCDVVAEQSVESWAFNVLTKYNLSDSWKLLYGGGLGYYRIAYKLSLAAQGREDREFDTINETSISPQIRLGLVYQNLEIIYSYSPNIGGPKTGSGNNQQFGILYLFGSE